MPGQPRFVAGSIGPTKVQLSFNANEPGHRPVTFDQMADSYAERNPAAEELVEVQVVQRRIDLEDGQRTGDVTDRVLIEYQLEDGE